MRRTALMMVLLMAALAAGSPARAVVMGAGDLLEAVGPPGWDMELALTLPQLPDASPPYLTPIDPEVIALEMIRDDNLAVLENFRAARVTLIPLASAHLYIVHVVRLSQIKKGPVEEVPQEEVTGGRWNIKWHVPEGQGLLQRATPQPTTGWRPFSWLFEEEGLLSGRPWSWENFMPRLMTVGGMVLGGLLAVEGMHALLAMGRRVIGGRERRGRRT